MRFLKGLFVGFLVVVAVTVLASPFLLTACAKKEAPVSKDVIVPVPETTPQAVTELTFSVTANPWLDTKIQLKKAGLEGKVSLKAATLLVCQQNSISVPEWGLNGKLNSRKIPKGYTLTVSLDDLYHLAEANAVSP